MPPSLPVFTPVCDSEALRLDCSSFKRSSFKKAAIAPRMRVQTDSDYGVNKASQEGLSDDDNWTSPLDEASPPLPTRW